MWSVVAVVVALSIWWVGAEVEPRTTASMKQLRLARQCLPHKVTNMTDHWLRYVRDLGHRTRLESVVLEQLEVRLKSGESVCFAVRGALQRATNYHRHVMQQREAEGLQAENAREGSGWQETLRLMQDAWPEIVPQCEQRLLAMPPNKLVPRVLSECMSQHRYNAFVALVLDNLAS